MVNKKSQTKEQKPSDREKILDIGQFERDLEAVRAIHASYLPDRAVNELICLQLGRRMPTHYEVAMANQSLQRMGYFPTKGPQGGYENQRDFKTCQKPRSRKTQT